MSNQPILKLQFLADPRFLRLVRDQVKGAAEEIGLAAKTGSEIVMAVNEACMNIMQHGYKGDLRGEIILEMHASRSEIEVHLKDFAPPADPAYIHPRDLNDIRPGGLGTFFMREMMDDCSYGQLDGACGNHLRMRKRII
jgi:sigma-B regulation protein RsbU (phosphoserine phosphatase)